MAKRTGRCMGFTFFVLLLLLGAFFFVAMGNVSADQEGDYSYTVKDGNATITGYIGAGGAVIIPSTLGGFTTVAIGDGAFFHDSSLTSLTIPDNVTSIGAYAFSWCISLISVTLGTGVTIIGLSAFDYCPLLTSVTIPDSVRSIQGSAFYDCAALTSVNIGRNVTSIGIYAFAYCGSLSSISFLGLIAPTDVGVNCFHATDPEISGHAYAASNFPAPGSTFHGLLMGAIIPEAPSAPTGLTAIAGDDHVLLNWTSPSYLGPGSITYHLFRNGTLVWSGSAVEYNDTNVVNSIEYSYKVAAQNAIGWGPNSTGVQTTPTASLMPGVPTNFHVTPGNGYVNLSWSAPTNSGSIQLTGYKIYRTNNSNVRLLATVTSGTSYRDTSVTNGLAYYYQVCAFSSVGNGVVTDIKSATPKVPQSDPLDPNIVQYIGIGVIAIMALAGAATFVMRRHRS